jgi:hypothetical protein
MSNIFKIAVLLLLSCISNPRKNQSLICTVPDAIISSNIPQVDKELEYIKVRNNYIEKFNKLINPVITDSLARMDKEAVSNLENRLFDILKDSKYSAKGKINLMTLLPYADFGLLDGLSFEIDSLRIVYTSKKIFLDCFKDENISRFENLTPKNLGHIFSAAFMCDARGYNLSSYKLNSDKDITAYGMVASGTNGFGPIFPRFLFVVVFQGNFIYMAIKDIAQFGDIEKCKILGDSIFPATDKLISEIHHSSLKNNSDIDLMEKAMDIYCDCFQKELKFDNHFKVIQKQIEKIAKIVEQ